MRLNDFYLAAAAIIPILVFADTVRDVIVVRVASEQLADRLNRSSPRVVALGGILWWLLYGWAEWICLRSLQIGHSANGGTTVVWIAIGFAGVQLAGPDVMTRFAKAGIWPSGSPPEKPADTDSPAHP